MSMEAVKITDVYSKEKLKQLLSAIAQVIREPVFVLDNKREIIVLLEMEGMECSQIHKNGFTNACVFDQTKCMSKQCFRNGKLVQSCIKCYGETIGTVVSCISQKTNENLAGYAVKLMSLMIEEKVYGSFKLKSPSNESDAGSAQVNSLYEISEELETIFEMKKIYDVVLEKAIKLFQVEKASIMILDDHKKNLSVAASYGIPSQKIKNVKIPIDKSISGFVVKKGEPLLVEEAAELPESVQSHIKNSSCRNSYKSSSFMSVPIILSPPNEKDKKMGVINMTDRSSEKAFSACDLKLLSALASLSAVSMNNSRLLGKLKDAERMNKELQIARKFQLNLLPKKKIPINGIDLSGLCMPAQIIGGDYYDYFIQSDGKIHTLISDVAGHNINSAMAMGMVRSTIRSTSQQEKSPAEVLSATNRLLYDDLDRAELLISIFYTCYDPINKMLLFSNGGHPYPLLYHSHEDTYEKLDTNGMMFGVSRNPLFEQRLISLKSNDVIVLYTDGLTEALNSCGNRYGEDRLLETVKHCSHQPSNQILDQISISINEHINNNTQMDDITTVVMKFS